jgi:hypothetical protein
MYALLYASRTRIDRGRADQELEAIVQVSLERNAEAGVTGALLATERFFAQWLEGTQPAVMATMDRIARDARHTNVTILRQEPAAARIFSDWSLARGGRSSFAETTIYRAYEGRDTSSVRNLTRLLQALADPAARSPLVP